MSCSATVKNLALDFAFSLREIDICDVFDDTVFISLLLQMVSQ